MNTNEKEVQRAIGLYPIWSKYFSPNELCPVCDQPDSCGDCNHKPLSLKDIKLLLGEK